ncbi:MAG TPA: sigma-70 family RNA polymerase sigma factor [Polyangiaceae bacterium]|jgi:RNA polymerase sigma-70 factor (ECF subfamily)|nr:sigma-70 family RNA polymerase sigma factor [Polyangiaceae bacterium]
MPTPCAASDAPSAIGGAVPERVPLSSSRFNAVYEANADFVWRNARRLGVGDVAIDDVVQSVFLVVFRRLDDFEGRSTLKTWLYEVLVRVVREHRRALRRKSPPRAEGAEPIDPSTLVAPAHQRPDRLADRNDAARLVRELLDELGDDKREVFAMAELEGLTLREIAEILREPAGTIASRLRAARTDFERAAARHRAREQRRST